MPVGIHFRGDTQANWTSVNPILGDREIAVETDTRKLKVGDGTTRWNSLPYIISVFGPLGSDLQCDSHIIYDLGIKNYWEKGNVLGSVSGSVTVDLSNGNVLKATSAGNTTWTFPSVTDASKAVSFTLLLTGGGSHTHTWPSLKWSKGVAPALSTTATDSLFFFCVNLQWYGVLTSYY